MENTIETINNIVNEDTVDIAAKAVEAVPVEAFNWRKLSKAGAAVGAVALVGYGIYKGVKHFQNKKQLKAAQEQAAATGVDNVQVAKDDFEEPVEPAEEK